MYTKRSRNNGIGRSQYYDNMHEVKQQAVANSKSLMASDKGNALGWGKTCPGKAIVEHRKAEIIAFH